MIYLGQWLNAGRVTQKILNEISTMFEDKLDVASYMKMINGNIYHFLCRNAEL